MIRSLTILTVMATLVACGGGAPEAPRPVRGKSSLDNGLRVDAADSLGLKQRTFVVANQRPMIEKVTLLNAQHAGISLPGQKLESAEESFIQGITSTGLRTTFALGGKPSSMSKVKVFFGETEQLETEFDYNASLNSLVLKNPPEQYTQIRVRYQVVTGTATSQGPVAKLSHKPDKDSLKISNANCDVSTGVVVENDVLIFKCAAVANSAELTVEYVYTDPELQMYDMKDVATPDEGIWEVKIDGKVCDSFSRNNTLISISDFLKPGAYVEISFKRDRTVSK